MSLKKHKGIKLDGAAVFYPRELKELQIFFDKNMLNVPAIEELVKKISPEIEVISGPTTSDKYYWFCAIKFPAKYVPMIVLLPWMQDFAFTDESQSDRHIGMVGVKDPEALQSLIDLYRGKRLKPISKIDQT
jgi:hypothetical protein